MKTASIKLKHFRQGTLNYYVGVDGEFLPNADPVSVATTLIKKLTQIKAYCAKYNKPVVVLVNSSRVPSYVHSTLRALNLNTISIVSKDVDAKCPMYYTVAKPLDFISKNTKVLLVLQPNTGETEFDVSELEIPKVELMYSLLDEKVSLTLNPNEVVKHFELPKLENKDPYAAFFHEPFFQRVPYTYWQDLMDSMPSTSEIKGTGVPNNIY